MTHKIDAVFLRLWTLAVPSECYVKADWKIVQEAVNGYCYAGKAQEAPTTAQGSRVLPGEWLCRSCGFKLSVRSLDPRDGRVGVRAALERHECPNDGALMDQATEADVIVALNECVESWVDALEEAGGSWWHVSRDLPPVGDRVLVAVRYEVGAVVTFGQLRTFNDRDGNPVSYWTAEDSVGAMTGQVTHWRRLPSVPGPDMGAGPDGTCSVVDPECFGPDPKAPPALEGD